MPILLPKIHEISSFQSLNWHKLTVTDQCVRGLSAKVSMLMIYILNFISITACVTIIVRVTEQLLVKIENITTAIFNNHILHVGGAQHTQT